VNSLTAGGYFGEIGLMTNLKRTASVKASNFCTLSEMSRDAFIATQNTYPQIYKRFKERLKEYKDFDFSFRRKMVRNIPYLREIDDALADEIIY